MCVGLLLTIWWVGLRMQGSLGLWSSGTSHGYLTTTKSQWTAMPRMHGSFLAGPDRDYSLMMQWLSTCCLQPDPAEDMLPTLLSSINGLCCGMKRHTQVGSYRRRGDRASLQRKPCCTNGFDCISPAGFDTSGPRDHLPCTTSAPPLTLTAWTRDRTAADIMYAKPCLGKRGRQWRARFSSTRPRRRYRRRRLKLSRRTLHRKWRQALMQCLLIQCPRHFAELCTPQRVAKACSCMCANYGYWYVAWAQRTADAFRQAGGDDSPTGGCVTMATPHRDLLEDASDGDYEQDIDSDDIPGAGTVHPANTRRTAHLCRAARLRRILSCVIALSALQREGVLVTPWEAPQH